MIETGNFRSTDLTQLFYRAPLSTGKGKKVVVVVHGFAEHSGRYGDILTELEANGYSPFSFDFRGHGHSEGKRGFINSFQDYIDDLGAAVAFARNRGSDEPVILLAHSMGALVAIHYAISQAQEVCGLVLSSPLFGIRVPVPKWKKELGTLMSKYWPSFGLPNSINADDLTHDQSKAEVYRSDPLIFHHVTARWFEEIVNITEESLTTASRLKHPFLLQLSDEDRIVSYEKSCQWYQENQSLDKNLLSYAGFFHEIYNEKGRTQPIGDFIEWMKARWPSKKSVDDAEKAVLQRSEDRNIQIGALS